MPANPTPRSAAERARALRTCCALLATCLLGLLVAVPFAVPSGSSTSKSKSDLPTYDDPETQRLLAEESARSERLARERRTPEARRRRVESRTAFGALGGREAAEVARDRFGELFDGPDGELLELKPGQRVVRYVSDNGAVVDSGKGRDSLVTSTLPMRSRNESGDLRPVDLGLEPSGDGFEPRNPVAAMRIDRDPSRALSVDGKFVLGDPGAAAQDGFRVGNNVFYAETATDTDMWLTPRPEGAELSYQLRSITSPETLTVDFDLPAGTSLEPTADGSVDVKRNGKAIASVAAPVAWDATEEEVPTSQRVRGDRILISAEHRGRDVEYPIAVDPIVWTYNLRDWDMWPPHNYAYEESGGDFSEYISTNQNLSFWGRGFYIRRRSSVYYYPGSWGQYVFRAFRASFVQNMQYFGVTHRGPTTHITTGIYGGSNYQNWESRNTWSHNFDNWTSGVYGGGVERNMGVFSIGAPNGGSVALRSGSPYYEGSAYIAGATSWESDYNAPWISKVHDETPGGWVHSAQPLVGWDSGDPGLGVKLVRISAPGHNTDDRWHGCGGTPDYRCPDWWGTHWYRYNTDAMSEGHQWISASSMDVINNWSGGAGTTVHIDRSAPSNSPSGDLVNRDGQLVTGDSYGMTASATDRWSGVGDVRIEVNGADQGAGGSCGSENCTVNRPFTFRPTREGLNTVTTKARDHLNHWAADRQIRVVSDRQKPGASVSHSGLPSAWVESASVDTTVSGTDSGAGVKRAVVAWSGGSRSKNFPNADTCTGAVDRQCPSSGSTTITYGSGDLADGINTVRGTAVDAAERSSDEHTWQLKLDRDAPRVTQSGSLYDRRGQEVPNGVYNVHVDSTDGSAASDATARAGVVHLELRLDDELQEERDVACATHSCALSLDWAVDTGKLSGGTHRVDVLARDRLGHEGTDSFTFTKSCCLALPVQSAWAAGPPQFGDATGDGRDDAVGRDALGQLHVARSNGDGFDASTAWGQGPLVGDFEVADANADGYDDVLWAEVTGELRVALSNGRGFAAGATWGNAAPAVKVHFGDVDGDRQADAVLYNDLTGAVSAAYSEGNGFEPGFQWTTWDTAYGFQLADVTGDGAADAIGRNSAGEVRVGVSDAGSFGETTSWGTWPADDLRFGDVNGDGLADVVARDPATGNVKYGSSSGHSFETAKAMGTWSGGTIDTAEVTGDDVFDLAGHDAVAGRLTVAASAAPTPLGPEADVTPADGDVDVEEDVLAPPPPQPAATQSVSAAAAAPPSGKPVLASEDERVLVYRGGLEPGDQDAQLDQVYRRLREAGVGLVRFNAFWGGIENRKTGSNPDTYAGGERYSWAVIDNAVTAARRNGMDVHLTFTGHAHNTSNECTITGNLNGIGCLDDAEHTRNPTGVAPTAAERADFGKFVEEGVRRYTRDDAGHPAVRVKSFGIWNEPNLSAWLDDNNSRTTMPTRLYRQLYGHAYTGWRAATAAVPHSDPAQARAAVTGTQILIGELSSGTRPARSSDRPNCTVETRGSRKCHWSSMDFLEAVVNGSSSVMRASGLAYHPYQSWNRPDRQPARYKQDGSYANGSSLELGISRLGKVEATLKTLCKPVNRRCTGDLRAPSDKRPGLYLTEFGYYNQPTARGDLLAHPKRNSYWHTERTKASWFRGTSSYPGALDMAARSKAKWMLLYHAIEVPPGPCAPPPGGPPPDCDPNEHGVHEYGLFDLPRPSQPNWTAGDEIVGERSYGKDHETKPTTFRKPQPRLAYCAIRQWAITNDYFPEPFPPDLMNRCAAPVDAHDDD